MLVGDRGDVKTTGGGATLYSRSDLMAGKRGSGVLG